MLSIEHTALLFSTQDHLSSSVTYGERPLNFATTLTAIHSMNSLCTEKVIDCDRDHSAFEGQSLRCRATWSGHMDYQRLLALLEERRAILLWEELWPNADDEDGQLARQMRMEEIELLVQECVRLSGHA